MGILYYTVAGIVLYLAADWLLNQIETRRGQRFEHRSIIFFFILLVFAILSFQLIQYLLAPSAATPPP